MESKINVDMKKLIIIHIASFIGIFLFMLGLYFFTPGNAVSNHVPVPIEVSLDIVGIVFLITAMLIWLLAWWVLVKQWNAQTIEQNLVAIAALIIGNIFGAYFVLYVHREKPRKKP